MHLGSVSVPGSYMTGSAVSSVDASMNEGNVYLRAGRGHRQALDLWIQIRSVEGAAADER